MPLERDIFHILPPPSKPRPPARRLDPKPTLEFFFSSKKLSRCPDAGNQRLTTTEVGRDGKCHRVEPGKGEKHGLSNREKTVPTPSRTISTASSTLPLPPSTINSQPTTSHF